MLKKNNHIYRAVFINAIIFALFYLLFYPIYNSGEDVHVLYMLSGGYGDMPTAMTHYNYGIHPLLAGTIKNLFRLTGGVNWYSVAMILPHYIGGTLILSQLFRQKPELTGYLAYAALFIVFEGYFLLYPDFTAASMILTIAALLLLMIKSRQAAPGIRWCIIAGLLLLLASFYRIHSMLFLAVLILPFFILIHERLAKTKVMLTLLASALLVITFNHAQEWYFRQQKNDWLQEEAYRQKIFRFFNNAASLKIPADGEKWHDEYQVTTSGLIMDSSYMPSARLDSMYRDLKGLKSNWQLPTGWKKWFYINNRLFFIVTLFFFVFYGYRKKILIPALTAFIVLLAGFAYLQLRAKAPSYVLTASLELICLSIFFSEKQPFSFSGKLGELIIPLCLGLVICWGLVRLYNTSDQNRNENYTFKNNYTEVAGHPHNLFIDVQDFNSRKFYVFDLPGKFSLSNYLIGERFINNTHSSALKRFRIQNIAGIFNSPDVLFWGEPDAALKKYFEKIAGRPLVFTGPLAEFKNGDVWSIEN